ncbi:AlwI family type II restriction endonuclease [Candidatus Glomeribacter gigasporarum]|uniref:AlwI family type II restriction endonuclease n=1 Tax=Candidatus Glomeribacter gigasporarum TaxID=132144 RepID=UPI0002F17A40|nr:AlwI family type II restriction endonuclease [Candidatus Glomeribacter gigasporarum]
MVLNEHAQPGDFIFVEKLIQEFHFPDSNRLYFVTLCNGATLPTDHKDSARAVLEGVVAGLSRYQQFVK